MKGILVVNRNRLIDLSHILSIEDMGGEISLTTVYGDYYVLDCWSKEKAIASFISKVVYSYIKQCIYCNVENIDIVDFTDSVTCKELMESFVDYAISHTEPTLKSTHNKEYWEDKKGFILQSGVIHNVKFNSCNIAAIGGVN